VLLLAAMPALAQPEDPPTPQPPDKQTANDKDDKKDGAQQTVGSNDRLFYALPNFQTVNTTEQLPPLTVGQKFKLQARSQFDYFEIPWYGILAGFSQARNTSAGYGQGAAGYGKRYASEWGDGTIENFMVAAVFPSALRQDPRYYVLAKGHFGIARATPSAASLSLVQIRDGRSSTHLRSSAAPLLRAFRPTATIPETSVLWATPRKCGAPRLG
jgi:hypothetical protein